MNLLVEFIDYRMFNDDDADIKIQQVENKIHDEIKTLHCVLWMVAIVILRS